MELTLDLSALNIIADILWASSINLAADAERRTEDLLNRTLQLLCQRLEPHRACNLNNLIESDGLAVLDVLLLLPVARGLLEGLDDEGRGGWDNGDSCLTVLDRKSDGDTESFLLRQTLLAPTLLPFLKFVGAAYPVASCLCDIFSDLLWGETKRTDLGSERRRCADLTTGCPEVAMRVLAVFVLWD